MPPHRRRRRMGHFSPKRRASAACVDAATPATPDRSSHSFCSRGEVPLGSRVDLVARDECRVRGSCSVSLSRRLKRQEGIEYLRVGNRVRPIFRNLRPFGAEALLVGVAVLNDQGLHALRVRYGNTKADWCSVIVKVEGITRYLEFIEQ